MRSAYRGLAFLIVLGVLVQGAAIAFGWFDVLNDVDAGATFTKDTEHNAGHALHGVNGMMVMPILGLLLLISSFFARVPGGVKWAAFVLLAIVAQVVLGIVAFSAPAVGALHGINAFILFALAFMTAHRVRGDAVTPTATPHAATA